MAALPVAFLHGEQALVGIALAGLVSCSSIRPRSRSGIAGEPTIYLRPSWEKNLPNFLSNLAEFRDRAAA